MKTPLIIAALLALPLAAQAADPAAEMAPEMKLAQKNGCLACHDLDVKKVGPAWREVARKYAGDGEAEAMLVTKVKKGGKGHWGEVPMPANVTVKDTDIKTLVQYVLALQ